MKNEWEKTYGLLLDFQDQYTDFLNTAQLKPEDYKTAMRTARLWEKVQKQVNNFSKFVSPVEAVAVKYPDSEKFMKAWKFYKDYLSEQHGITMQSRYELKALEYLFKLSGKDVTKAIELIDITVGHGAKSFFIPTSQSPDKSKPKDKDYDPDFD
jgi:hypothetical protein